MKWDASRQRFDSTKTKHSISTSISNWLHILEFLGMAGQRNIIIIIIIVIVIIAETLLDRRREWEECLDLTPFGPAGRYAQQ